MSQKRGRCLGKCIQFKAQKPTSGEGRYESGQARCQTCAIFISEEGLDPPPKNPQGDLLYCKCCGVRVRKKPRSRESKELLQRNSENDTSEIPQADDLFKAMNMLKLINEGIKSKIDIADRLNIATRQVDYYKKAIEVLGFIKIENNSYESISLTPISYEIITSNWEKKINIIKKQVMTIPLYKSLIEILKQKEEIDKAELFSIFSSKTNISNATSKRRFSTFLRWLDYLDMISYYKNMVLWNQIDFDNKRPISNYSSTVQPKKLTKIEPVKNQYSDIDYSCFKIESSKEETIEKLNELKKQIQTKCKKLDAEQNYFDYSHEEMFKLLEEYLALLPNNEKYANIKTFF